MNWPRRTAVFLRAKKYDPRKARLPLYLEEKHNGHRVLVVRDHSRELFAFTRTVGTELVRDKNLSLPDWADDLRICTAVETEMIWPGHPSSDVPTAVKSHQDQLQFIPFGIPYEGGIDHRDDSYFHHAKLIKRVTGYSCYPAVYSELPNEERLIEQARIANIEGYVLKEAGYAGWWKVKVVHTIDLELVGFTAGDGKYSDTIGAMILEDGEGVQVRCSGMTEEIRYSVNEDDFGRIVEVKYNSVTSGGKLQHPRFIGWRDDKEKADVIRETV